MIIMMIIWPELSSVFVTTNQRQKSFVCGQKAKSERRAYFLFLEILFLVRNKSQKMIFIKKLYSKPKTKEFCIMAKNKKGAPRLFLFSRNFVSY